MIDARKPPLYNACVMSIQQPTSDSPPATAAPSVARSPTSSVLLRHPITLLVGLTLVALALRLYKLGYQDYWDDEILTLLAPRPPAHVILLSLETYTIHPPLYYILVHFWMVFGSDIITIRLLSVLMGTASVPLIYLVGRKLISQPVALAAAALLTISPAHVFYSQQARIYVLFVLVVLGTTILFLNAWQHGGWHRWLVFGVGVAAAFYSHTYAPFSVLGMDAWALIESYRQRRIDRGRWIGLIAAQLMGVVLFLPFVPQLTRTVESVQKAFWISKNSPFDWLPSLAEGSNGATFLLQDRITAPTTGSLTTALGFIAVVVGAAVVVIALIASSRAARNAPEERGAWLLLLCLVFSPIVVATGISLTIKSIIVTRYLLGISPPLYLLLAWVGVRTWHLPRARLVALTFLASMVVSLAAVYPDVPRENKRVRLVSDMIEAKQPGDALAITYWHHFDIIAALYPHEEDVYRVIVGDVAKHKATFAKKSSYIGWHLPQNAQPVETFAPRYKRVWFHLTVYDYSYAAYQEEKEWLDQHGRLVWQRAYDEGTTLFLYEMSP